MYPVFTRARFSTPWTRAWRNEREGESECRLNVADEDDMAFAVAMEPLQSPPVLGYDSDGPVLLPI